MATDDTAPAGDAADAGTGEIDLTETGGTPQVRAHAKGGRGHRANKPWWQRARYVGGAAIALLAVAGGVSFAALSGAEPVADAASPSPSASETEEPVVVTPSPSPTVEENPYLTTIATVSGEELPVFANAGDPTPTRTLSPWTYYAQPLTLVSEATTSINGEDWHYVTLPVQPNGQDGWIRGSDVTLSSTTKEVHVLLDERVVLLFEDGVQTMAVPAVIGRPDTPTPTGTFYVTDALDLSANPTGVYGSGALGLSGYSEVLTEFNGGPPQLAIHGTNATWLLGERASNGCVRIENKHINNLLVVLDRGTPVHIHDTRSADLLPNAEAPAA